MKMSQYYRKKGFLKKIVKKVYFSMPSGIFLYGYYAKNLMLKEGFKEQDLNVIFNSDWLVKNADQTESINCDSLDSLLLTVQKETILMNNSKFSLKSKVNHISLKSVNQDQTLTIKNVPYGIGWWWEGIEDRVYEGEIEISINSKASL